MDSQDSIESFAASLAQAEKPEQPAKADSALALEQDGGDDTASLDAALSGQEPQGDEPAIDPQSEQPPEGSESPAEVIHKWTTANGEKIEATESELRQGYLRTQDYTRKTQEVAETLRLSQANIQQQQQLLGALSTENAEIQTLQNQVNSFNGVDWGTLDVQDPQTADRARIRLLNLRQSLSDAQQRAGHKAQQLSALAEQQFSQAVSAAEQKLAAKLPDLTREGVVKVFNRMRELGATQTELNYARGMPWLVELAVYADKWVELQAKKPEALNKVRNLPPATTAPRAAVPSSKTEAALKAINSRRSFSANEFAQLMKATR